MQARNSAIVLLFFFIFFSLPPFFTQLNQRPPTQTGQIHLLLPLTMVNKHAYCFFIKFIILLFYEKC